MAVISFRAKAEKIYNRDGSVAYERVKVPMFTRSHCDMAAFRRHPRYGSLANSDLFPGALRKIREERLGAGRNYVRLDQPPKGFTVDKSGFLIHVSFEV